MGSRARQKRHMSSALEWMDFWIHPVWGKKDVSCFERTDFGYRERGQERVTALGAVVG